MSKTVATVSELLRHPSLVLLVGAALLAVLRGRARASVAVIAPAAALGLVQWVPDGPVWTVGFLDYALMPFAGDALGRLFATVFSIAALAGGVFALGAQAGQQGKHSLELPAAYVYAASAIGVAFAADLLTVFIFWELMAIGSTLVLWSAATPASYRASMRYAMVHLLGGVLLLAGIAGHIAQTGDLTFTAMQADSVAHWLILLGFLINAGAPPLSAWVSDAYPEASVSGMVFLSAFTTKTAVLVLWRGFAGTELLIGVGLFMVLYGIVYALLENDMRRVFAYSIVNQVGFMVVGIGIGTEMALNGAAAHAFAHIIYKALLLMSAGSVLLMTGRRSYAQLGGLYRTMPLTTVCAAVGALAISAFPLTSGFISKSMVTQSAIDEHLLWVWLLLTAASAGTFLYAGVRFLWFVFFGQDSGLRPKDPPWLMRVAMLLMALLCVAPGLWPQWLYARLPFAVDYVPYTSAHVLTQLQLLLFAALAFFWTLPLLKRTSTITLDADWLYRRALSRLAMGADQMFGRLRLRTQQAWSGGTAWLLAMTERYHGMEGRFSLTWPIRSMALWVLVLLFTYLTLYFLRRAGYV